MIDKIVFIVINFNKLSIKCRFSLSTRYKFKEYLKIKQPKKKSSKNLDKVKGSQKVNRDIEDLLKKLLSKTTKDQSKTLIHICYKENLAIINQKISLHKIE